MAPGRALLPWRPWQLVLSFSPSFEMSGTKVASFGGRPSALVTSQPLPFRCLFVGSLRGSKCWQVELMLTVLVMGPGQSPGLPAPRHCSAGHTHWCFRFLTFPF